MTSLTGIWHHWQLLSLVSLTGILCFLDPLHLIPGSSVTMNIVTLKLSKLQAITFSELLKWPPKFPHSLAQTPDLFVSSLTPPWRFVIRYNKFCHTDKTNWKTAWSGSLGGRGNLFWQPLTSHKSQFLVSCNQCPTQELQIFQSGRVLRSCCVNHNQKNCRAKSWWVHSSQPLTINNKTTHRPCYTVFLTIVKCCLPHYPATDLVSYNFGRAHILTLPTHSQVQRSQFLTVLVVAVSWLTISDGGSVLAHTHTKSTTTTTQETVIGRRNSFW